MPSGVYRLRNSKKAPKSTRGIRMANPQTGTVGTNVTDVNVGSDLAPKKYRPFETTKGEFTRYTKPPMSAEEPVRGEGKLRARDPKHGSSS